MNRIRILPINDNYRLRDWVQYTQIPESNECLEITITFNHKFHDRASSLATLTAGVKNNVIDYIATILAPDTFIYSIEYQKNGYAHAHCLLIYNDPDDRPTPELRYDFIRAMSRKCGDTTCKPVINPQAYLEYIYKDVQRNNIERTFPHNYIYTRI